MPRLSSMLWVFARRRATGTSVALVVISLSVVGCGFHLRGSLTQLTDLGSIYVDASRDLSIVDAVEEALIDSGFKLANNRDNAQILLRLAEENQSERVLSINSSGRVSELELSHSVGILIAESRDGSTPSYPQDQALNQVSVRREYTYDETGVLGKENEARILRAEMEDELVRQIVLRIIASLSSSISSATVN